MKGAVKISNVMIMGAIGMSIFLGMMTFMAELDDNYSITTPQNSSDTIEEIFEDMNKTATDTQNTLTGEQSWLETSFNIVFRLPNTVTSTVITMANSAGKLLGVATGPDMAEVPIPTWILTIILLMIGIIIATTLFYLIMGRGF